MDEFVNGDCTRCAYLNKLDSLQKSLAPIREVYEEFKPLMELMKGNPLAMTTFPYAEGFLKMWQAVRKSIEGEEG